MPEPDHRWQEIRFTVEQEAAEAIEFALNSLDASGTSIDLMPRTYDGVQVVGYFQELPEDERIQDELHYALKSYGFNEDSIIAVERTEIENTDWLAEWKKHWKPTTIGSFVIAAPWHDVDELERLVIRIEPNMAFGTGTHETTQLCLKAIDELYEPGNSFLDVGTGTGILAIAAALKTNLSKKTEEANITGRNPSDSEGARRSISLRGAGSEGLNIYGYDTDPDAIEIAKENARINNVENVIWFFASPISMETPAADLVCANLTLDVIVPTLPLLLSKAKKYLVLSGILEIQKASIRRELENLEVSNFEIETASEWIAVIVHR